MAHRLLGARVLITGGTSGIGLATRQMLLERTGISALGLIGRDAAVLDAASSAPFARGKVHTAVLDLKELAGIKPAVDSLASRMGGVDIVINNAGHMTAGLNTMNCSLDAWQHEMAVNLSAPFLLTQAAVPHLKRSDRAAIVNVSSICSSVAFENLLPYCSAKAGLDQLTRCCALELGPHGIRVNAVHPGIIDTPLNRRAFATDEEYEEYLLKSSSLHPVQRCGLPDDVAEIVLFLADTKVSGFITGQMHTIDGGRTLPAPSLQFKAESTQAAAVPSQEEPIQAANTKGANNMTSSTSCATAPMKLGSMDTQSMYGTPFLERSISNRVILVTGAGRGIGAALAAQLCNRGAKVLVADRLKAELDTTAREIEAAASYVYDQTDVESIKGMFEAISADFGHLDVLVPNAGVMAGLGIDITDTDDHLEAMNWRVNAEGCSQLVKYALPLLFNRGEDAEFERTVVFVGSSSARLNEPDPGYGALSYRGSRTAVNGMMVALHSLYCDDNANAVELRKDRKLHRVVSGDPGYVASKLGLDDPLTRGLRKVTAEELVNFKSADGAQTPEEGADTLLYLVCAEKIPQNGRMYYQRKVVPW